MLSFTKQRENNNEDLGNASQTCDFKISYLSESIGGKMHVKITEWLKSHRKLLTHLVWLNVGVYWPNLIKVLRIIDL